MKPLRHEAVTCRPATLDLQHLCELLSIPVRIRHAPRLPRPPPMTVAARHPSRHRSSVASSVGCAPTSRHLHATDHLQRHAPEGRAQIGKQEALPFGATVVGVGAHRACQRDDEDGAKHVHSSPARRRTTSDHAPTDTSHRYLDPRKEPLRGTLFDSLDVTDTCCRRCKCDVPGEG